MSPPLWTTELRARHSPDRTFCPVRPVPGPPRRAERDAARATVREADAERTVSAAHHAHVSVARWTDPATITEAHAWLRETANSAGRRVTGPIEQPHVRPWSTVFRAPTDHSDVYLKLCGPSQATSPR